MLNIDSLSKEFIMHIRGDAQIDGFQDISFSVEPGTLVAITGPSAPTPPLAATLGTPGRTALPWI